MATRTVTTLAYVRTSTGVVKVDPGSPLPGDLLEGEVERLGAVLAVEQPTAGGRGRQQGSGDS